MRARLTLRLLVSVSVLVLAQTVGLQGAKAGDSLLLEGAAALRMRSTQNTPQPTDMTGSMPASSPALTSGLRDTTLPASVQLADESALRYYAASNQRARVNLEIERLKRLHPAWEPPQNLYDAAAPSGEDETDLWELFGNNQLDTLNLAIEQRKRKEPSWQPSSDLTQKILHKTQRFQILALAQAGQVKDVIEFVHRPDFVVDDSDVEVLWLVADAYVRLKQRADALGIYRMILTTSLDTKQRVATLQKAMANLPMNDVETLIAMGRPSPDGRNEFAVIFADIVQARISAYLHEARLEEVDPAELAAFGDVARASSNSDQPGLMGWYYLKLKDDRQAFDWFKLALERGGDAMTAHGLANALKNLGLRRETEDVAYAWREPLVNNTVVYLDILETDLTNPLPPAIEPERLLRYARTALETTSGEGAQGLAWYAYNTCQYDVAWEWFQRAVAWFPKENTVYGYALTANRLNKKKDLYEIANRYDGLFPKVMEVLFPDGANHPPSPCDNAEAVKHHPQAQVAAGFTVPGPSNFETRQSQGQIQKQIQPQFQLQIVAPAQPSGQAYGAGWDGTQMPKINRADFPVPVDPENPLRAAGLVNGRGSMATTNFSLTLGLPAEPIRGPQAQVARRVPGVGPMPYEHWGFNLLPGWNGVSVATWPPAPAQLAPLGSLWAKEGGGPANTAQAGAGQGGGLPVSRAQPATTLAGESIIGPGGGGTQVAPTPRLVPASAWGAGQQQGGQLAPTVYERRSQRSMGRLTAALENMDPDSAFATDPTGPMARFVPLDTMATGWILRPSEGSAPTAAAPVGTLGTGSAEISPHHKGFGRVGLMTKIQKFAAPSTPSPRLASAMSTNTAPAAAAPPALELRR